MFLGVLLTVAVAFAYDSISGRAANGRAGAAALSPAPLAVPAQTPALDSGSLADVDFATAHANGLSEYRQHPEEQRCA
jgi:hypothetical protein